MGLAINAPRLDFSFDIIDIVVSLPIPSSMIKETLVGAFGVVAICSFFTCMKKRGRKSKKINN